MQYGRADRYMSAAVRRHNVITALGERQRLCAHARTVRVHYRNAIKLDGLYDASANAFKRRIKLRRAAFEIEPHGRVRRIAQPRDIPRRQIVIVCLSALTAERTEPYRGGDGERDKKYECCV